MGLLQCIWMFQWRAPYSFLVDSDASLNVVVLCYSIHAARIRVPCRLQGADCYFRYVGCRRFVMVVDDAGLSDDALSWIIQ